jgi:hypothetical protein
MDAQSWPDSKSQEREGIQCKDEVATGWKVKCVLSNVLVGYRRFSTLPYHILPYNPSYFRIDLVITVTVFSFFMWGGKLPCRYGVAAFYLLSLAQHTGESSWSSTAEGYATISSVSFGLLYT